MAHPERLTGWAAGANAEALGGRGDQAILDDALATPASMGVHPQVRDARVFDWTQDPFACGAYSYVALGGEDARAARAAPVDDTLFFAGEATHTGAQLGTVHGAMETGERAARGDSRYPR